MHWEDLEEGQWPPGGPVISEAKLNELISKAYEFKPTRFVTVEVTPESMGLTAGDFEAAIANARAGAVKQNKEVL